MLWSRKPTPPTAKTKLVGLDLTSTRARAVLAAGGKCRALPLDAPAEELLLLVNLEARAPDVGRAGLAAVRKWPHLVAQNYLPRLGLPHEWRGPRLTLSPEGALAALFAKLRPTLAADSDALGLVLPSYMSDAQTKSLANLAEKAKLPLRGTANAALALVAHRAANVLAASPAHERPEWVVPLRTNAAGPGGVVVIDADDHATTATLVQVNPAEAKLVASAHWPRASAKLWKDRLLDAISDKCVRVCRRDPRDSAEAEQALYEQLDSLLDRAQANQPATVNVRSEHWYQDLTFQPAELAGACGNLASLTAAGLKELLEAAAAPPKAVWLTASAAKLPGLAAAIYQQSAERTGLALLPADAGAEAAASLVPLWLAGSLPAQPTATLAVTLARSAAASRAGG